MRLVLLCVLCAFVVGCGPRKISDEAKAYASSIEFRNVRLSAAETYAKQTIYYLRIDVHNKGQRPVRELQIMLYFRNAQGELLMSHPVTAISPRLRSLGPGETRDFRQGFDPPPGWNRTSPNIGITYLDIE